MLWYDAAKSLLEYEEELEQFMKAVLQVKDTVGCLADDLAYPANCLYYKTPINSSQIDFKCRDN
jgi:hypothetical protein